MKHLFQNIFESNPVSLILISEHGDIKVVNRNAENLFGYDRAELIDKPIEILVPEAHRLRHPDLVRAYILDPQPRRMGVGRNLFGTKKNGKEFPIEVGLNPIQSDEGLFIMSSVIDISDRVRAEERFRSAVEAAPNGMVMIDSNGRIILVNQQTEEMFGYTRNELIGQAIELLVPLEVRSQHPLFVKGYIIKPEPRSMGIGRELFGRRKDGSKIPVEIGLRPIFSDDGVFVISSIVDVTERQKSAALLRDKNEELEQFAYRTSHDLRSPLLSISQIGDCIAEDINDKNYDEALANVAKIKSISSRLRVLIEDILALTRSDFVNEAVSSFDFAGVVAAAREKLALEIGQGAFEFRTSFNHEKPLVIQTTRLGQVLDNFISNAIKYRDLAKESCFVALTTYNDAEFFYIQIKDNGLGIPKERHPEVFGMFKRFHSESAVGSGLGLYIVRKHLAKMGAEVRFESSEQGTTFYLKLCTNQGKVQHG